MRVAVAGVWTECGARRLASAQAQACVHGADPHLCPHCYLCSLFTKGHQPCALGPHYGVSLNPQHAQPREPLDAPPSPAVRRVHRRPGNAARRRPLGGRPTPMARITALDSDISLAGGLVEPRLSRDEPRSIEERTRAAVSASHESADRSSGKSVLGLPTGGLDYGVYVLRERDLGGAPFERAPRHSLPSR